MVEKRPSGEKPSGNNKIKLASSNGERSPVEAIRQVVTSNANSWTRRVLTEKTSCGERSDRPTMDRARTYSLKTLIILSTAVISVTHYRSWLKFEVLL